MVIITGLVIEMRYAEPNGREKKIQENDEGKFMCEAGKRFSVYVEGYNSTSSHLILDVEVDGQNANYVFQLPPRTKFKCEFDGVNVSANGTERRPFYLAPLESNNSGSSSEVSATSANPVGKIEVSFFKRGELAAAQQHPRVSMKRKFSDDDKKFFEQNGVQTQLLPPTKKPAFLL